MHQVLFCKIRSRTSARLMFNNRIWNCQQITVYKIIFNKQGYYPRSFWIKARVLKNFLHETAFNEKEILYSIMWVSLWNRLAFVRFDRLIRFAKMIKTILVTCVTFFIWNFNIFKSEWLKNDPNNLLTDIDICKPRILFALC